MSAVPKLRFPEFKTAYASRYLGDEVSKISSGKTKAEPDGDYKLYGSTGVLGNTNSPECHEQNILIARVGANAGALNIVEGSYGVTDNTLILSATETSCLNYIFYFLKSFNLNRLVFGSGQPLVTGGMIKKLKFSHPALPEQQKIASFLSSVDKKIDLLRQKKDTLELYKKGLMQKIFSQEIRFKQDDGSDFPDWEEVTVGDMAERHVRGLTSSTLNFVEKGYPVYGASGMIGYIDNYLSEQRYIGVVKDGAGVGRVFEAVEQSSLLSTMESLIPKSGFSFGFVKQVIKDIDFKKFTTGSTIPHVYFKDYSKESYPCPAYEEQERIAHLLDLFDAKIQNTSSQIEQMENFKKGLLQQMFV